MTVDETANLRDLLRAVGATGAPLPLAPAGRPDVDEAVVVADEAIADVRNLPPAEPAGFLDGIQHGVTLTYREQRPVILAFVAAGIVDSDARVVDLREELFMMAAAEDREWLQASAGSIRLDTFTVAHPDDMAAQAFTNLAARRETLERELADVYVAGSDPRPLIIDGSLVGRPFDSRLSGVVKSTATRYFENEDELRTLPEGHRSPRFVIPAGAGHSNDRHSAYVRLGSTEGHAWNHSLIRVETFTKTAVDEIAALCFRSRQMKNARDIRWDRHIQGIRRVEEVLRARRPPIF